MEKIDGFTDQVIQTIENARQNAGITVAELILRSGITRRTYFRKMRGDTEFTTSDIDAIAKALGVDPFLILRKASYAVEKAKVSFNPAAMSEDEKKQWTLEHMEEYGFAANTNPNKEQEMKNDGTI